MENTPVTPIAPVAPPIEKTNYLVPILIVIILSLGVILGFVIFKKADSPKINSLSMNSENVESVAAIKGNFNINGVVPAGATFDLLATAVSTDNQVTFQSGISAFDNDSWQFNDAKVGESYTIQAVLKKDGIQISQSSPVTVTAPAQDVNLTLNLESSPTPQAQNATIVGDIVVNGFIPDKSTISIQGKVLGSTKFSTVAAGLPGQERQVMSYTSAKSGVTYEVQGVLLAADGKTVLGTSGLLAVTAPAAHEELTINSSAQAPAQTPVPTAQPTQVPVSSASPVMTPTPKPAPPAKPVVISGSVTLNGIAPANSRIVLLQKVYNSSNYTVAIDNIKPVNGVSWTWKDPAQSTWYDLVAVLKQRQPDGSDKDVSTSSKQSVAAPATNVGLTLNSGFGLNPPNGQIGVNCGNQSGDSWNAKVSFGSESGAQSYWYQIGTSNGGNELTNSTVNVSGNDPLTVTVQLHSGTSYYARYGQSTQQNLNVGDSQFSPFSNTQEIKCG